jgi:hypothetical protein
MPASLDPQLALDERAVTNPELEAVLERRLRAKDDVAEDELGARTGYEPTGGGFRNALGKLRTLELIRGDRNGLQASPDLVDA